MMSTQLIYVFSYNQSNKAEVLEQNKRRKEQIERKIGKIDTEQKSIIENIDKLRKDLSTQKVGLTWKVLELVVKDELTGSIWP